MTLTVAPADPSDTHAAQAEVHSLLEQRSGFDQLKELAVYDAKRATQMSVMSPMKHAHAKGRDGLCDTMCWVSLSTCVAHVIWQC